MADRRMPWFPVNAVDILTRSDFVCMTNAQLGAFFRLAAYYWLNGEIPEIGDWAREPYLSIRDRAETWIKQVEQEQIAKYEKAVGRQASWKAKKDAYKKKLQDPRWQRRRLEIMQRDGWACKRCSSINRILQVHHLAYQNGVEPWDHPDELLITLCAPCHEDGTDG